MPKKLSPGRVVQFVTQILHPDSARSPDSSQSITQTPPSPSPLPNEMDARTAIQPEFTWVNPESLASGAPQNPVDARTAIQPESTWVNPESLASEAASLPQPPDQPSQGSTPRPLASPAPDRSMPTVASTPPPQPAKDTPIAPDPSLTPIGRPTLTESPSAPSAESTQVKTTRSRLTQVGHGLMVLSALGAGFLSLGNLPMIRGWERQAQSLIFRVRGPIDPPSNVMILAIDDESLSELSGASWPLRRALYARAINSVLKAGAKVVAVDMRWDLPSSFGDQEAVSTDCSITDAEVSADDRQLQKVLQRHDGRVVLAADMDVVNSRQGQQVRLSLPYCPFRTPKGVVGSIRFLTEPNQQIHRLGSAYINQVKGTQLFEGEKIRSFAEATLKTARLRYPSPQGEEIFFYGGAQSFGRTTVPFWNVLNRDTWNDTYLKQGKVFKNKIVLIGPTAAKVGDILNTPFGEMPGVELHANAIATLLQNRSLRLAFPDPKLASLAVIALVLLAGLIQAQAKRPVARLMVAAALVTVWGAICYGVLTQGLLILPIVLPMVGVGVVGLSYFGTGLAYEYWSKRQFRKTLKHYAASPLVQEIINQQEDLQDLLKEREQEILGKKLAGRYQIVRLLGSGGFGETYVAADVQRPGRPECVVKQLRPTSNNPKHLQLARRLFQSEAETLERLGEHEQIPRLLAYFEEDQEFYLVQEMIEGPSLSTELSVGRHLTEARIVQILQELLEILRFVHTKQVIHRDIKPSNVIKRQADGRLVLIDFGAVKALHHQMSDAETMATVTIGIGTQGYMPPEQCAGNPRFSSDIYAVGMMGIQGLTGVPPSQLQESSQTGEVVWQNRAIVNPSLAAVLSKMVHYDYRVRYASAAEVLQDLARIPRLSTQIPQQRPSAPPTSEAKSLAPDRGITDEPPTKPWPPALRAEDPPPTQPPQ